MTDQDSEQRSISDFPSGEIRDSRERAASTDRNPPSLDDLPALLKWLRSQDTISSSTAENLLPGLVEKALTDGYDAWTAGNCINLILEETASSLDCDCLVSVLGNEHVDTGLVRDSLIEAFPSKQARLDSSIVIGSLNVDELSHVERMETYRLLSRLPPDERVYSKLKSVSDMFNGTASVGTTHYNLDGFFHSYSMRCLLLFLQHPDEGSRSLALKAITDHRWSALRIITGNPIAAAECELIDPMVRAIQGHATRTDFNDGTIVTRLCSAYLDSGDQQNRQSLSDLILAVLGAGINPTNWEDILDRLARDIDVADSPDQTGMLVAKVLEKTVDMEVDFERLGTVISVERAVGGLGDIPSGWAHPVKRLAEAWPEAFLDHVDSLVAVARSNGDWERRVICETIAGIGEDFPASVVPEIEILVRDLERANSASDVEDVGVILRSLDVYPEPPQLRELYGSTDPEIDSAAKSLVADLRRQFRESEPVVTPEEVDNLSELTEKYTLVRRTGAVTWESPQLSDVELSLVTEIAQMSSTMPGPGDESAGMVAGKISELTGISNEASAENTDHSVQFVTPSNDSTWVVYSLLGALLGLLVDTEIQVTFHSPATSGWGTKRDVRESLQGFGLVEKDKPTSKVTPLLDLVPTARVTNGQLVVETSSTTIGEDPPFLTIVRDLQSLKESPADIVLYNFLPGIDGPNAAQLFSWRGGVEESGSVQQLIGGDTARFSADGAGIADQASLLNLIQIDDLSESDYESGHPDNPIHIEIHGIFSAQYAADRRQHVGPPTDLPRPYLLTNEREEILGNSSNSSNESSIARVHAASSLLEGPSSVDLHAVRSDAEIGQLIAKLDGYTEKIENEEAVRALRSFRYTVGGLPVPSALHDRWISEQLDSGNKWVPRRLRDRRNGIQSISEDAAYGGEIIEDALITIDTILERIDDSNPLFEKLLEVLDEAAKEEKKVGILCGKKSYKDMLDIYLRDRASDWALGEDLLLLDEDSVREESEQSIDWLVAFDPLPPQTAIYYHHPATEKTIVIAHADGTLSGRVFGIDQRRRPYLPRQLDEDLPELDVTSLGSDIEASEGESSFTDDLYRTYLSVAANSRDDGSGSGDSSYEISQYRLEFEEAPAVTLFDAHPVITRSEDHLVSAGAFGLRSLSRITSGDEIVLIDNDAHADLWEQFLRKDWEESGEEDVDAEEAFMDAVGLWYDAVTSGLQQHAENDDLASGLRGFVEEIEPGVSVSSDAVEDWARGVMRADSPTELVFRSDLRIGPRNADGVEAVAKAFGDDRMTENWEQVFTRIKTIRTTNRQRGSVFWEWLADRACDGDLFNEPGVDRVGVSKCVKLE